MTFLEYLIDNGKEFERFDFNSPDEAYNFGVKIRYNIEMEGDADTIEVDISNTVVRVKVLEPVLV